MELFRHRKSVYLELKMLMSVYLSSERDRNGVNDHPDDLIMGSMRTLCNYHEQNLLWSCRGLLLAKGGVIIVWFFQELHRKMHEDSKRWLLPNLFSIHEIATLYLKFKVSLAHQEAREEPCEREIILVHLKPLWFGSFSDLPRFFTCKH